MYVEDPDIRIFLKSEPPRAMCGCAQGPIGIISHFAAGQNGHLEEYADTALGCYWFGWMERNTRERRQNMLRVDNTLIKCFWNSANLQKFLWQYLTWKQQTMLNLLM